jgi:hypothetical protein
MSRCNSSAQLCLCLPLLRSVLPCNVKFSYHVFALLHSESLCRPVTLKRHFFSRISEGPNKNEEKPATIQMNLHTFIYLFTTAPADMAAFQFLNPYSR